MLHQTQVSRVAAAWDAFVARFPDPATTAAAEPADVLREWGHLGYPRRARWLWEAARAVAARGWPDDLTELPGVGRYTAAAIAAQVDDGPDAIGVDANIRRVCQRVVGTRLTERAAERTAVDVSAPLTGRDRFLALMDLGALVCTPRAPRCPDCPLHDRCATRGTLAGERRVAQARYAGSFRQRRGAVLARLREADAPVASLDDDALASLVADRLVEVRRTTARLARA